MEYSQVYEITRVMHARPLAELTTTIERLKRKYTDLEVKLEDPKTSRTFDYASLLSMLVLGGPFNKGEKVKILIRGKYSREILKECTDQVGRTFIRKDTSRTAYEEIHKLNYGKYPN